MSEIANGLLVSVIIPTYNRADVVKRAINSAQLQTYKNLEIIVVDDASVDNTAEVVKSIIDHRLNYICHRTNLGGSEARNTGIKQAQGQYIAFLDSDDVWLADKLMAQLEAIAPHASQSNIVCYGQFQKSNQVFYQRSVLPMRGIGKFNVAEYLWLFGGEMLTSTLLISRNIAVTTSFKSKLVKFD